MTLQSKLDVLKARASGRRLFVKVFLWFWLTVLLLFAIFMTGRTAGNHLLAPTEVVAAFAPTVASDAVRAYESGGTHEFAQFERGLMGGSERELYLIDGFGKDVLARPTPPESLSIIHAARTDGRVVARFGLYSRSAAYRFISPSGRPYVLLFHARMQFVEGASALGVPFFGGMLLLVTLFCFWLAHHIVAPIQGIQSAARKVANGDLNVRAPLGISKRHDELAALAVDFDSMVERIGALVRSQRDLLNTVSHELRSPLARFNMSMALLRKQSSPKSEPLLQRMEREVERIDLLMRQLLTLLRLEAGLSSRTWEGVDFAQLVHEVVADGDFEAQSCGKSVRLQSAANIFLEKADQYALRSACENVIRNAIRFTPSRTEVEVTLTTEGGSSASHAVLSVRDRGPGVPEDFLHQIFQPFFRIKASGSRGENSGTGLGLAIALEAVRQHGGSIIASNVSPAGLEVKITVPTRVGV